METLLLFRDDAYLKETSAVVTAVTPEGGIIVDRTIFYATAGGQPGDRGVLVRADGSEIGIETAVYSPSKAEIVHIPASGYEPPEAGEAVALRLDWPTRHKRMRMHTALHLLSVALPFPVTGGSIGDEESRLDFDIPEGGLDKDAITAKVNEMIATGARVKERWISDEELVANPGLVKTMSVKPPMGSGKVRLVEIEGLDLQPCGGTHVRGLDEIGAVQVTKIEKKGQQNRRVRLAWA
ncbi:alanyl-tRNA editing protein [Ancylobacter dichloromethanicus]|uniref:Alanine--tRNA ligase n=1 Tax=Ancylobacter dichloromethanicus TaxID=518825 RepID=A0A9W6JA13_9HYPH|nr:alanyl-tRNA editing protein [Ancylobacter dichloromethanicus]MBS7554768.1 alanyl-tRNA editing protein [Ancylobacter dichloromethanicus]GLK72453.1 serine-tRNA(Ala) deacylase AlaX [Ancylobacter dichloromethanicus]